MGKIFIHMYIRFNLCDGGTYVKNCEFSCAIIPARYMYIHLTLGSSIFLFAEYIYIRGRLLFCAVYSPKGIVYSVIYIYIYMQSRVFLYFYIIEQTNVPEGGCWRHIVHVGPHSSHHQGHLHVVKHQRYSIYKTDGNISSRNVSRRSYDLTTSNSVYTYGCYMFVINT